MKYFSVIKKVSLVSAGNIFNAGLGLIFLTASARVLSIDDFGKYALLTTLLVFMSKVVDFGSNSVFVAESLKTDGGDLLIARFYTLKVVLFVLSLIMSIIILYFLGFRSALILLTFFLGLIFYSINVTFFAIFQSAEMFTHAVLINTIPALLKAILGGLILLRIFSPSFASIYAIFCLSMGLCTLLYFFVPKEFKKFIVLDVLKPGFIPILKTSSPAGLSQLISQGWPAISNSIVKISKGFSDVGIFYLADKVANVFNLISLSIFTVILPQNARRKKENLPHDIKETLILGILVLFVALSFISVSGIFISQLFGDKFSGSLIILDILIISSAITAIHSFMENFFYVHDSTKTIMYISLAKLATFILLALFLLPALSLKGLAFSQLIASIAGLLLVTLLTLKPNIKV